MFLVTLQNAINWIWGVVGIALFGILLMFGIKLYKNIRAKKDWDTSDEDDALEEEEN